MAPGAHRGTGCLWTINTSVRRRQTLLQAHPRPRFMPGEHQGVANPPARWILPFDPSKIFPVAAGFGPCHRPNGGDVPPGEIHHTVDVDPIGNQEAGGAAQP